MAPRNPSELQRLTEEYYDLKRQLKQSYWPKAQKQGVLRQLQEYEKILGIEGKDYNSGDF